MVMASPGAFSRTCSGSRADHFQADLAKAEPADAIDEGDESFQPRDFVGADQDPCLARMGEERGVELLIGVSCRSLAAAS